MHTHMHMAEVTWVTHICSNLAASQFRMVLNWSKKVKPFCSTVLKALQLHYAQSETFTTQRASQNLILTKIYLCVNYLSWLSIINSGDFLLLVNNFNKSANGALRSEVWVPICHYSTVGNACVQTSHVCCCEMLSHLGWCTCLCVEVCLVGRTRCPSHTNSRV